VIWLLHHGDPHTQRELSRGLKCTPRNVTGLVDALEGAGFVARRVHPTDRRATIVSLTKRGTTVVTAWHRDRVHGAARLIGATSAAELATFVTVLDRVLGSLRAAQQVDDEPAGRRSRGDRDDTGGGVATDHVGRAKPSARSR
jgi:DNA-binding MarR family transcriptional regulator